MQIEYLADHQQELETVNDWLYEEWGHHHPGRDRKKSLQRLKGKLENKKEIPIVFVALEGNEATGTASLVKHDMKTRQEYSPWLASVFVRPDSRKQGIGSALVKRVEEEAQNLGIEVLYLFTPDRESFYSRLGWERLEETVYRQEEVVIMKKVLGRQGV